MSLYIKLSSPRILPIIALECVLISYSPLHWSNSLVRDLHHNLTRDFEGKGGKHLRLYKFW